MNSKRNAHDVRLTEICHYIFIQALGLCQPNATGRQNIIMEIFCGKIVPNKVDNYAKHSLRKVSPVVSYCIHLTLRKMFWTLHTRHSFIICCTINQRNLI